MRSAKTFILGGLCIVGGAFLGTFAARLPTHEPSAHTSFFISSLKAATHAPALTPPKKTTTQLTGLLSNEAGDPITGATLSLQSQQTTSDAEGRFCFPQIEPGLVSLQIHHPDYLPYQGEAMQAMPGSDLEALITLQRPRIVSIQLRSKQGKPLSAVEISAPEHEPALTNALGEARVERSEGQMTTARVLAKGFQPLLLSLGDEDSISLTLQRPGALRGELRGAPQGTQLLLLPMHDGNLTTTPQLTNADPLFAFRGLLPGEYQLWAKHQGKTWRLQALRVKEGENQLRVSFIPEPPLDREACEASFTPSVLVERQEGVLVVQKPEGELMAGDRVISIDGVLLGGESGFLASWAGSRGSLARLTVERPASKRFLFVALPRIAELPCPTEANKR